MGGAALPSTPKPDTLVASDAKRALARFRERVRERRERAGEGFSRALNSREHKYFQ
jgi:hypothetical protein